MADEVFISYSHKDQEFVIRLASDLDPQVGGVWFDQSDIRAGDKWRERISEGIRHCKVFVVILSPDAVASKYVQDEINQAVERGKRIIPILYRTVKLTGGLADLVDETQNIDLRRGSYADNFQHLVDALLDAGAVRQGAAGPARPFLRGPTRTDWGAVFGKIFGWALAWGIGWAIFWFFIFVVVALESSSPPHGGYVLLGVGMPVGGGLGGAAGGLLAGIITMLSLRRYAASIAWKHMAPSIWIWVLSGVLGAVISGVVGLAAAQGTMQSMGASLTDCSGASIGDCLGKVFVGSLVSGIVGVLVAVLIILIVVLVIWFFTGTFAGWLAVRHIRRLEPGITTGQAFWVIIGWGLGALAGTIGALLLISVITGNS